MSLRRFALVLWLACSVFGTAARADFAHLTLHSQPGDFIGQGMDFDLTYASPGSTVSAQIRRTLSEGSPAELLCVLDQHGTMNTFATLFFGTDALGIPIQPGTYTDAQRADFAAPGHPGLDIGFQNRGCNTLTGSFTITELTFFRDGSNALQIGTLAASFEQHCEGAPPALFGTFEFRSSVAPVPEPGSLALLGLGAAGLLVYGWRRERPERAIPEMARGHAAMLHGDGVCR